MTAENDNKPVEPALNGDEPSVSAEEPSVEPNGSDGNGSDPSEAFEAEEAAPVAGAPSPPPSVAEEPTAVEEPPDVEALAAAEVPVDTPPSEEGEPASQREPSAEPSAVSDVPSDEVVSAASREEPVPAPDAETPIPAEHPAAPIAEERAEEPAQRQESEPAEEAPSEDPSSIAGDIQQALAAAAATAKASAEAAERAAVEADVEVPVPVAESEPTGDGLLPGESGDGEAVAARIFQPGDWFVVHTYAGYENKVKANLQSRISSMNMEEKIFEVTIPMEDVMEIKSGKKQVVSRKVFPGYLLVRMDLDDDSWYVVRNTPGVTGFVGSGTKPIPLSEREVDRILHRKAVGERPKPKLEWSIGDPVRVTTGPFANFQGVISEIDTDRSKLKVLVNIFGRETPVELGFDQVAKV